MLRENLLLNQPASSGGHGLSVRRTDRSLQREGATQHSPSLSSELRSNFKKVEMTFSPFCDHYEWLSRLGTAQGFQLAGQEVTGNFQPVPYGAGIPGTAWRAAFT